MYYVSDGSLVCRFMYVLYITLRRRLIYDVPDTSRVLRFGYV